MTAHRLSAKLDSKDVLQRSARLDSSHREGIVAALAEHMKTRSHGGSVSSAWVSLEATLPERSRKERIQTYVDLLEAPWLVEYRRPRATRGSGAGHRAAVPRGYLALRRLGHHR